MTLGELLTEEMVFTLQCDSKELLFEELSKKMVRHCGELSHQEILLALKEREQEMTTGIGLGVAIPHGRIHTLNKPAMVFLRLEEGLKEYNSLDGLPVHFVFGLLTPKGSEQLHCSILKEVSQILAREENRNQLLQASTIQDMHSILLNSSYN